MDTGLNPCSNGRYSQSLKLLWVLKNKVVLILVLMEDTLRVAIDIHIVALFGSLNPCSNGRYSQRHDSRFGVEVGIVLILVLMEDTLRVTMVTLFIRMIWS